MQSFVKLSMGFLNKLKSFDEEITIIEKERKAYFEDFKIRENTLL